MKQKQSGSKIILKNSNQNIMLGILLKRPEFMAVKVETKLILVLVVFTRKRPVLWAYGNRGPSYRSFVWSTLRTSACHILVTASASTQPRKKGPEIFFEDLSVVKSVTWHRIIISIQSFLRSQSLKFLFFKSRKTFNRLNVRKKCFFRFVEHWAII